MEDTIKTQLGGSSLAGDVAILLMRLNEASHFERQRALRVILEELTELLAQSVGRRAA